MSARTTAAPSAANSCAVARPIPLAAPVTTATLPSSRPIRLTLTVVWLARPIERSAPSGRAPVASAIVILIDAERIGAARPNRPLFADVSLTISDGDRLGVVGLNGSGKSTLLRILAGETQPETGVVRRGRGVRIGFLGQSPTLPAGSVAEIVGHEWQ